MDGTSSRFRALATLTTPSRLLDHHTRLLPMPIRGRVAQAPLARAQHAETEPAAENTGY
ncbi:hypothetical protein FRC11_003618, partial [Ceratobasidium sp. 423]